MRTPFKTLGLALVVGFLTTISCQSNGTTVVPSSATIATLSPAGRLPRRQHQLAERRMQARLLCLTGGNGGVYTTGSTIASTGVTGLTASLQAGSLASGAGNLTFTISGTPSGAGTPTFALSFGGQTCSLALSVGAPGSGTVM